MHHFTSPTPTSLSGSVLVTFVVDDWEIECCAPPPALGDRCSWYLSFNPAGQGDVPSPLVTEHDLRARAGRDRVLVDGTVVAHWYSGHGPCPAEATLPGTLVGSAHGGQIPDDLAPVQGRVQRVRLVREEFVCVEDRNGRQLERVPGSLTLTDVRESPRWFASPRFEAGTTGIRETGVLIDVKVPAASLPADPPPS